jgi:hypothetical protein
VVWPNVELPVDGTLILLEVDETTGALPSIDVNSGALITTRSSSIEHFPNGFPWVEPAQTFDCINVLNANFGNLNTGYRQWLIQAKTVLEECTETITVQRPEWWPEDQP